MKIFKKLLSVFICLAIILCVLPFGTFSATAEEEDEYTEYISGYYTYTISNNEATIVAFDNTFKGDLIIPETLGGYPVTRIDNYVFYGCSLTNITLPKTLVSIGYYAFHNSRYFRDETNWEGNALYIGDFLISVNIVGLTEYEVKNGTKYIADYAFYSNEDASSFKTVILPDSVLRIGNSAFESCTVLENITFSKNLTHIGNFAFMSCVSLKSLTLPNSMEKIGDFAFQYCSSITDLTMGDSTAYIGDYAFQYCDLLKAVNIPQNVSYLSGFAFQFCNMLTDINVSENNKYYSSQDGVLFNKDKTELINYPAGKNQTSYTVPNGVEVIGDYAFQYADKLLTITLPDSVKIICYRAFGDCASLENVTLGNGLKEMGETAFYRCSSLSEITIPDGAEIIGGYAFGHCTALEKINLPDTVTKIGYSAFYNTGYYNDSANWEDGVLYLDNYLIDTTPELAGKYTIKAGTKHISDSAFYGCTVLTDIIIPSSVTSIGDSAFFGCDSLQNVYFEGSKEVWDEIDVYGYNETLTSSGIKYDYIISGTNPNAETLVMLKIALLGGNQNLTLDFYADGVIDIRDLIALKNILLG